MTGDGGEREGTKGEETVKCSRGKEEEQDVGEEKKVKNL